MLLFYFYSMSYAVKNFVDSFDVCRGHPCGQKRIKLALPKDNWSFQQKSQNCSFRNCG